MHKVLTNFVLVTAFWSSLATAWSGCAPGPDDALVCGEGKHAVSVFSETISPSKKLAFGWRTPTRKGGMPAARIASIRRVNVDPRL